MASTGFSIAMATSTSCNFPTTTTTSFIATSNNHTPITSFVSSLSSSNRRYSPTMNFSSSVQQQQQHQQQQQQQPFISNERSRTTNSPLLSTNDSSQQQQQRQQETTMYCSDKNSCVTKRCRDGSNSLNIVLSTISPVVTPQQHMLQQQQQQQMHSPCEYRILSPSTPTHPLTTGSAIEACSGIIPFSPVHVGAAVLPVQQQQQQQDDNTIQPYASATKRTRSNTYIAPREVGKTFNNQVGSIAAAFYPTNCLQSQQQQQQQHPNSHNGFIRPMIRRQLSGSKIESFLSGNSLMDDNNNNNTESMDVEEVTNRPRSMSF